MFGTIREARTGGREAHPDVREWSEDVPDVRGSREALPDVREWSGGPPECPGVVGMPAQMSRNDCEALPHVR